jgi:FtsZ-interacting cell division protein ZipA
MKKLFTVLGTLMAITIAAIVLVILWYRLKAVFKRRQKQKKMLEQQARLTLSTSNNNNNQNPSTALRYASADMLSSAVQSTPLTGNKSQSQALIASAMPTPTIYKNIDAIADDSIQNLTTTNEANTSQQTNLTGPRTTEIEAITPC